MTRAMMNAPRNRKVKPKPLLQKNMRLTRINGGAVVLQVEHEGFWVEVGRLPALFKFTLIPADLVQARIDEAMKEAAEIRAGRKD